ncbi:hypothetical protein GTW69_04845, partial [Streptomyces sp. SID7760]|nr:hypothetical protein [Streptomyces sp. SID7760]
APAPAPASRPSAPQAQPLTRQPNQGQGQQGQQAHRQAEPEQHIPGDGTDTVALRTVRMGRR